MPGPEIARLSTEHARLLAAWSACCTAQTELHTAEELCLDALARDVDAVDLIDGAIAQRRQFRRDLYRLLVALRQPGPGATLLVHTPDARGAVAAWVTMVMQAAAHHGYAAAVHQWNEHAPGWKLPWGPPHDLAWVRESMSVWNPAALLVRITGSGADLLFALEAGLHRFHGIAGEACHVWVDALEPKTDFSEIEWGVIPQPPAPRLARGAAMREVQVDGDVVQVGRETVDVPWSEMPERLTEVAAARILTTLATDDADEDSLWTWDHPLQALIAAQDAEGPP
jgi:hypothetical protein